MLFHVTMTRSVDQLRDKLKKKNRIEITRQTSLIICMNVTEGWEVGGREAFCLHWDPNAHILVILP